MWVREFSSFSSLSSKKFCDVEYICEFIVPKGTATLWPLPGLRKPTLISIHSVESKSYRQPKWSCRPIPENWGSIFGYFSDDIEKRR